MTSSIDTPLTILAALRSLDRAEITLIVRRALEDDGVEVDAWDVHPLGYDFTSPISGGLHRVIGTAHGSNRRLSWSLVHKAVRSAAGVEMPNGEVVPRDLPDDPSFFGYWKREPLIYGAGLLEDLPGGLTAPRCYGVSARPDGTIWIWLEEVKAAEQTPWTPQRCAHAARVLGRFNGAYLSGRPVPAHPCVERGWLRSWLTVRIAPLMEEIGRDPAWTHPLVRGAFPVPVLDRLIRLWADRDLLLDGLDRLPHTFCHRDAFRSNLFVPRGTENEERLVAMDWAYAGIGPVGEDISPLIAAAPARDGPELAPWGVEPPIFDAYLQGLAEGGWRGEAWTVRFGYAASATLRYLFLTVGEMLGDVRDERGHTAIEKRRGQPIEGVMEQHAALIHFLLDLAEEVRALLPRVCAAPRTEGQLT